MDDEDNEESKIFKEIIEEKNSPKLEKYNKYPYLKYFTYTIYKKSELKEFEKQISAQENYEEKYPIIYSYLNESQSSLKKLQILRYIEKYNEFCNTMIENYSFKITREEAKKQQLKDEEIFRLKEDKCKEFIKIWNDNIKKKATKYKKNKDMEKKDLNDKTELAYFLNDDNELGYGMYIAAGYEHFIKVQNEFINFVMDHGEDKPYLKFYFDNMNNKIPIYEANNNQIVLIYFIFKSSEYKFFSDLVNTFTRRKIYNEDGTVDYSKDKYNQLDFDFQSIEEELARLILPGKCLFEDESHLNFINYWGEGFNGGKSDVLERFENDNKTEELTNDEKMRIYNYIKSNYNINDHNDLKQLYSYLQLIIFYLINNINDIGKSIKNIIEGSNDIKINDKNFIAIFEGNEMTLTGNKIISIFIFIEHLCFDVFSQNLIEEYNAQIDENIKNKIKDELTKNEDIKEIGPVSRRFISRFLYNINNKDDLSPNGALTIQLKRKDLWNKEFRETEKIERILESIEKFNLKVGQCFNFYQLIKEKDEKEINAYSDKIGGEQKNIPDKNTQGKNKKRKFKN